MDDGELPTNPLPFHVFCREVLCDRFGSSSDAWIERLRCEPHEPAQWAQGVAMPTVPMLIQLHEAVMSATSHVSGAQRDRWLALIEEATVDVADIPAEIACTYAGTLAWTMQKTMSVEIGSRLQKLPLKDRLALMRRFLDYCDVALHYSRKR